MADLWVFDTNIHSWNLLGDKSPELMRDSNWPDSRSHSLTWKTFNQFWLYGGLNNTDYGNQQYSDLWKFQGIKY